jgi:hypothetical protein
MRRSLLLCWLAALLIPMPIAAQTPASDAPVDPATRGIGPCDGLNIYQGFYLVAYSRTSSEHAAAITLLLGASESGMDPDAYFSSLASEDFQLLQAYYLALAEVMDEISPPEFASTWHELQQDSLRLTGEIYGEAVRLGLSQAGVGHGEESAQVIAELNAFFASPNPCPAFLTWAREQSVFGTLLN